jgi:hypothetical protein
MTAAAADSGTAADPWTLTTPPEKSEFEAWRDEASDPPALVVQMARRSCVTSCEASTTCTQC